MDPRLQGLRDFLYTLELNPDEMPKTVLADAAALAKCINKLAAAEYAKRVVREHRDGA